MNKFYRSAEDRAQLLSELRRRWALNRAYWIQKKGGKCDGCGKKKDDIFFRKKEIGTKGRILSLHATSPLSPRLVGEMEGVVLRCKNCQRIYRMRERAKIKGQLGVWNYKIPLG